MKNVLILEGSPQTRRKLKMIFASLDIRTFVYATDSVRDAYVHAMSDDIDLFVVDIVPDSRKSATADGITFVEKIREISYYKFTPVVIISALEDPKLYAYSRLHCYSYLEKPFDFEEAAVQFADILAATPDRPEATAHFYFRKGGILYSVETRRIVSITVNSKKMELRCVDDSLEIPYIPLSELQKLLGPRCFLQCNRSTIVNRRFIRAVDTVNNYVLLTGDLGYLDIGRVIKNDFLDRYCNDFKNADGKSSLCGG